MLPVPPDNHVDVTPVTPRVKPCDKELGTPKYKSKATTKYFKYLMCLDQIQAAPPNVGPALTVAPFRSATGALVANRYNTSAFHDQECIVLTTPHERLRSATMKYDGAFFSHRDRGQNTAANTGQSCGYRLSWETWSKRRFGAGTYKARPSRFPIRSD